MDVINSPKYTSSIDFGCLQDFINSDRTYNKNFTEYELEVKRVSSNEFNECEFCKIKASGIEFYNVQFVDITFENCDFSNSTFELCSFIRCKFSNCKLLGVNFINSSFQHVLFNGVLKYINFANNKFKKVIFSESILEDGRFLDDKFLNLYFDKCNITRVEFSKCNLVGIDLSSCEFDDIRIRPDDLKGIKMNSYQACIIARKLGIIIE